MEWNAVNNITIWWLRTISVGFSWVQLWETTTMNDGYVTRADYKKGESIKLAMFLNNLDNRMVNYKSYYNCDNWNTQRFVI